MPLIRLSSILLFVNFATKVINSTLGTTMKDHACSLAPESKDAAAQDAIGRSIGDPSLADKTITFTNGTVSLTTVLGAYLSLTAYTQLITPPRFALVPYARSAERQGTKRRSTTS